jgi:hypothetical protein
VEAVSTEKDWAKGDRRGQEDKRDHARASSLQQRLHRHLPKR